MHLRRRRNPPNVDIMSEKRRCENCMRWKTSNLSTRKADNNELRLAELADAQGNHAARCYTDRNERATAARI